MRLQDVPERVNPVNLVRPQPVSRQPRALPFSPPRRNLPSASPSAPSSLQPLEASRSSGAAARQSGGATAFLGACVADSHVRCSQAPHFRERGFTKEDKRLECPWDGKKYDGKYSAAIAALQLPFSCPPRTQPAGALLPNRPRAALC